MSFKISGTNALELFKANNEARLFAAINQRFLSNEDILQQIPFHDDAKTEHKKKKKGIPHPLHRFPPRTSERCFPLFKVLSMEVQKLQVEQR